MILLGVYWIGLSRDSGVLETFLLLGLDIGQLGMCDFVFCPEAIVIFIGKTWAIFLPYFSQF